MNWRGEAIRAESSLAGKRKRAAMRQDQPDATRSSLKVAAGPRPRVKSVLVIDVGGASVKILATGRPESRSFRSGPKLTPGQMVSEVKKLAADWTYDVVSIGYPGPVLAARPAAEPVNLGRGWIAFVATRAALRSQPSDLAEPRPVCVVGRPCVHVALRDAALERSEGRQSEI